MSRYKELIEESGVEDDIIAGMLKDPIHEAFFRRYQRLLQSLELNTLDLHDEAAELDRIGIEIQESLISVQNGSSYAERVKELGPNIEVQKRRIQAQLDSNPLYTRTRQRVNDLTDDVRLVKFQLDAMLELRRLSQLEVGGR